MPPIRRRTRDPYAKQVLGVYRGPRRTTEPPKLTDHRLLLLRAIGDKEIKRGHASFANQWRWRGVTVTKSVQPFLGCGWAREVGAHLELTETGQTALGGAP
jgi:hypothetical protein